MRIFKILALIFVLAVLCGIIFSPTVEIYYRCSSCEAEMVNMNYYVLPGRKVYKNYEAKADHEHDFRATKIVVYTWLGLGNVAINY